MIYGFLQCLLIIILYKYTEDQLIMKLRNIIIENKNQQNISGKEHSASSNKSLRPQKYQKFMPSSFLEEESSFSLFGGHDETKNQGIFSINSLKDSKSKGKISNQVIRQDLEAITSFGIQKVKSENSIMFPCRQNNQNQQSKRRSQRKLSFLQKNSGIEKYFESFPHQNGDRNYNNNVDKVKDDKQQKSKLLSEKHLQEIKLLFQEAEQKIEKKIEEFLDRLSQRLFQQEQQLGRWFGIFRADEKKISSEFIDQAKSIFRELQRTLETLRNQNQAIKPQLQDQRKSKRRYRSSIEPIKEDPLQESTKNINQNHIPHFSLKKLVSFNVNSTQQETSTEIIVPQAVKSPINKANIQMKKNSILANSQIQRNIYQPLEDIKGQIYKNIKPSRSHNYNRKYSEQIKMNKCQFQATLNKVKGILQNK